MLVDNPGSIVIYMHSEPSRDIDFCCWGPFTSEDCCTQLACNKVVDCSYSPAPTETCNINNAQTGQYYMLVITNFSNQPCNIIFEQTGGNGTTDCTILPPPCSNNSPICVGQTLQLTAQAVANATYRWSGPNNFSSNLQNPNIPNAQLINAGDYYLTIYVNGQPSADSTKSTAYIYQTVANAGNDTAIANGVFATLHGSCTGGSGAYHYHWEPANMLVDPDVQHPQTINLFASQVFTLTATDDTANCQATDLVTVNVVGGALAVSAIATPSSICFGTTSQLQAFGSGGAGTYTYQWTAPGGFSSNLQNPTVQPQATTTYTVTVSDGYNQETNTVTVTVIPLPIAVAGEDKSIPHGTYTFLSGYVPNGTSSYFYSWSPPDKLINPNIQFPQTVNLTATQVYSLEVTDLVTNCVSDNNATVTVEVTGGPLGVNPVASPAWICKGDTTQLHGGAGGGNVGFYEYTWTSNPPGFTSTLPDPMVTPIVNTTYYVSVYDGFNTINGTTAVSIFPQPVVNIGPVDSVVCIYDTVLLNAGNPGASYLWSNGSADRTLLVESTGISYDFQTYTVDVTNSDGCTTRDSINIIFSPSACVGIGENTVHGFVRLYPNPAQGELFIELNDIPGETKAGIYDLFGRQILFLRLDGSDGRKVVSRHDLSNISKGIYFVRFEHEIYSSSHKLVIQ